MAEPVWLKTISNHAVITRDELLQWLGVDKLQLKSMLKNDGLPPPRFTGINAKQDSGVITKCSRWRVGDVRAWLDGGARLKKEIETDIAIEASRHTKTVRENDGGWFVGKKSSKPLTRRY